MDDYPGLSLYLFKYRDNEVQLSNIFNAKIYFGYYKGYKLQDLPVNYQQWIHKEFDDSILKRWIKICLEHGKFAPPRQDESRC